jgi:hypothetical protein
MSASKKWVCTLSLALAGLLSLLLSLLGFFALTWGSLAQAIKSPPTLALLLPYVLAFPLFVLSVAVSKHASHVLWIMAPIPGLAMTWFSIHDPKQSAIYFPEFLAELACTVLPLLALAALVHCGTHFYEFTHDRKWVRWKKPNHEPAA